MIWAITNSLFLLIIPLAECPAVGFGETLNQPVELPIS
jgi:hypothetical protein